MRFPFVLDGLVVLLMLGISSQSKALNTTESIGAQTIPGFVDAATLTGDWACESQGTNGSGGGVQYLPTGNGFTVLVLTVDCSNSASTFTYVWVDEGPTPPHAKSCYYDGVNATCFSDQDTPPVVSLMSTSPASRSSASSASSSLASAWMPSTPSTWSASRIRT